MAHQLVLLINLLGLLLIDPFFLADISITQNVPTNMVPGSEVRVTVTVSKARYRADSPNCNWTSLRDSP